MKIVGIGGVCLENEHLEQLKNIATVTLHSTTSTDEAEIIAQINDADILISALVKLSKNVLSNAPQLKLIVLATTGFDDVDLEAAQQKKISVCYAPGYATQAVAEHTIGLMLAAARLSFAAVTDLKQGIYDHCRYQGRELYGKKLGIIGYGRIGKRVAEMAQGGFAMQVRFVDQNSSRADLESLLKDSDFISLHVPLSPQTQNMIGERECALMKDGVVFINTARGGLVDEKALLRYIQSGKIFGAGLDVLVQPIQKTNPLLQLPNVIVTPHMAYNSREALAQRSQIVVENITRYLAGKPQNMVCKP